MKVTYTLQHGGRQFEVQVLSVKFELIDGEFHAVCEIPMSKIPQAIPVSHIVEIA